MNISCINVSLLIGFKYSLFIGYSCVIISVSYLIVYLFHIVLQFVGNNHNWFKCKVNSFVHWYYLCFV